MSKKLSRGFGGRMQKRNDDQQELRALAAYGELYQLDYEHDSERFINRLTEAMTDRAERFGMQEWRYGAKWLMEVMKHQRERMALLTNYQGDDPNTQKGTWISFVITFNDHTDQIGEYRKNGVFYPAPMADTINEVLNQFITAVEYGPNIDDLGEQRVNHHEIEIFSTNDLLEIISDLWKRRRLDADDYVDEKNRIFAERWEQVKPAVIEAERVINRKKKLINPDPKPAELQDRRNDAQRQYNKVIERTFQYAMNRLNSERKKEVRFYRQERGK